VATPSNHGWRDFVPTGGGFPPGRNHLV